MANKLKPVFVSRNIFNTILPLAKSFSTASSPLLDNVGRFEGEEKHKMAAWQIHSYGGLEELQLSKSVRIPTIMNPNDILIKVSAASVNPIDIAMMGEKYSFHEIYVHYILQ